MEDCRVALLAVLLIASLILLLSEGTASEIELSKASRLSNTHSSCLQALQSLPRPRRRPPKDPALAPPTTPPQTARAAAAYGGRQMGAAAGLCQ
jgi:hypothetical protein